MKKSNKLLSIKIVLIIAAVTLTYIMFTKPKVEYAPFAVKAISSSGNIVESDIVMEGTPESDLMAAHPKGSSVFAKGGLNYIIAKEGEDELFFSLCSTKIIDGKVNVVEGFNPQQDKLKIFCAHNKIMPEDIKIIHDSVESKPVTYVQIQGKHSLTAIALLGNIDIKVDDIILNERWVAPAKAELK